MKLVDTDLKEIFEEHNITNCIHAYSFLSDTGCYTRLECMSNALHYFDIDTVNYYDVIIVGGITYNPNNFEPNNTFTCKFGKIKNIDHLNDYFIYCLDDQNNEIKGYDIHMDAYEYWIEISECQINDYGYFAKHFNGKIVNKNTQSLSIITGGNGTLVGRNNVVTGSDALPPFGVVNTQRTIGDIINQRRR